jgi:TrwC relaxase/AAA domain
VGVVGVLTISSGHSADYLLDAVASGRENYYTGAVAAGEPPGRWYGAGAAALGLTGEVDAQDMRAVFEHFVDPADPAFRNPAGWDTASTLGHAGRRYATAEQLYTRALEAEPHADAERREHLRVEASKAERKNVAFLDATFSVQKSVTVLHTAFEAQEVAARTAGREEEAAAWGRHRQAIEDGIWAGNNAMLDYLAHHAGYSRVGHHGGAAGRFVDAHDWIITSFFQHDSRDHDPQLHIHNPILNRVCCADGEWRTVDGRSLYRFRGAAAAVGERVMQEYLSRVLGVQFAMRPDGKSWEIVGVAQTAMDLFSSRRQAITPKQAELIAVFEAEFGRAPNGLERDRIARQATFATRRAKSHDGQTRQEMVREWDRRLRAEIRGGLATVAHGVLARRGQALAPMTWSPVAVLETALAAVQEKKAAWTASDLTREINNALPACLGITDPAALGRLLDTLTAEGLKLAIALDAARPGAGVEPDELRRADGESVYQAPGARLYATPEHVHTERVLLAALAHRDAAALGERAVDRFFTQLAAIDVRLGVDQAAAVRGVLTSGAQVESLIGPAGTGKSFVVGALAKAWTDPTLWSEGATPAGPRPHSIDNYRGDREPAEVIERDAVWFTEHYTQARLEHDLTLLEQAPGGGGGEDVETLRRAVDLARRANGRRVFGLATSQLAAEVLADQGVTAVNTARWLAIQDRLADGRGTDGDGEWVLGGGDLVVVDESSMADTTALAAIHHRVTIAGAKLLLVGDHHQLGAVGAGGALDLLANTGAGTAYELVEARRFSNQWEREASLRLRAGDVSVVAEYHRHGRVIDGGSVEATEHVAARRWLGDTLAGKQALLVVDTNAQAARINADIRGELVRLGRVTETGVRLGRDGTYAGVGDVVQARRLAWELAGHAGNTRGPLTGERFQIMQVCPDGSIVVASLRTTPTTTAAQAGAGVGGAGGVCGERLTLPAAYVAADVTLGYAVTGHAAEGLTVEVSHTIATTGTRAHALYPAATRGRESNTIYVVTQTAPSAEAETGETAQAVRRDPRAILATILESADAVRERSATATGDDSAVETEKIRTPGELFADAVAHIATVRTKTWLDVLVDNGLLSIEQRGRIAAEDGAASLGRVLRRVELAGHDPRQTLTDAVSERGFDKVRQLTNVIHHRIVQRCDLDPLGDTYAAWTPTVEREDWRRYLTTLATNADTRRDALGAQTVIEGPRWAIEALGPIPVDPIERLGWQSKAATVAAHRELTGHTDPDTAIGAAPAPGLVEAHASWRAAWRALGRPEVDRDEQEMSDGQLRMRVRAYQREQTWAPRNVTNELAGTIQAADHQRSVATRRAAEAHATTNPAERSRLEREAVEATALVETLTGQIERLRELETARGRWLAHTAGTRVAYDRARLELAHRRATDEHLEPQISAEEWLAAQAEAMRAEDEYRPITDETDFTDSTDEASGEQAEWAAPVKTGVLDLREVAETEPAPVDEHTVRVPTAQETAASIQRAQRALVEMAARDAADAARMRERERQEQLARWHAEDQTDAGEHGNEREAGLDEPALGTGHR